MTLCISSLDLMCLHGEKCSAFKDSVTNGYLRLDFSISNLDTSSLIDFLQGLCSHSVTVCKRLKLGLPVVDLSIGKCWTSLFMLSANVLTFNVSTWTLPWFIYVDVYRWKKRHKRKKESEEENEKEREKPDQDELKIQLGQEARDGFLDLRHSLIVWYICIQTKILWEIFSLMLYIPIVYPILQIMLFISSRKKKNGAVCATSLQTNRFV